MELQSIFQVDNFLDILCDMLLNDRTCDDLVKYSDVVCEQIEENCFSAAVIPQKLLQVFNKLQVNNRACDIVYQILESVVPESISDELVKSIISCKDVAIRGECIVILSHKQISSVQLRMLCHTNIAFECWFSLIERLFVDESCTLSEFQDILNDFIRSPFGVMHKMLKYELQNITSKDPGKTELLQKL